MHFLQKIGLGFLGVLALLLGAWLALNWHDEAPSAWAQQLSMRRALPPEAGNVYFSMFGFLAPPRLDMAAEGRRKIAAYQAYLANLTKGKPSIFAQQEQAEAPLLPAELAPLPGELQLPAGKIAWCKPSLSCLQKTAAEADQQSWQTLSGQHPELLARYRQLLAQKDAIYDGPIFMGNNAPLPEFAGVQMARRLLLHEALPSAWSARFTPLLDFLQQDMAFWRRVLGGHNSLISDMVAMTNLREDVTWLSALLAEARFDLNAHDAQLQALLRPLSRQEIDLSPAFQHEFLIHEALLREAAQLQAHPDSWSSWSKRFLLLPYKPQATINLQAETARLYLDLARAPINQFDARAPKLDAAIRAALRQKNWCYEFLCLFNPVGQILVEVGVLDYSIYIVRAFDLAAYFQMIGVQKERGNNK